MNQNAAVTLLSKLIAHLIRNSFGFSCVARFQDPRIDLGAVPIQQFFLGAVPGVLDELFHEAR